MVRKLEADIKVRQQFQRQHRLLLSRGLSQKFWAQWYKIFMIFDFFLFAFKKQKTTFHRISAMKIHIFHENVSVFILYILT